MTVLFGTTVTLRPVTALDIPRLTEILAQPEVARWWPGYDAERTRREFLEAPDVTAFTITVVGDLIGSAQYHEEPSDDYRHASIDVFLDPAWHGKRLGSDSVRALARHLLYERGHHRLAIDPPAANAKAIRAYRRVGFKPIGTARHYSRDGDGQWKDALLMDLLKQDLQ